MFFSAGPSDLRAAMDVCGFQEFRPSRRTLPKHPARLDVKRPLRIPVAEVAEGRALGNRFGRMRRTSTRRAVLCGAILAPGGMPRACFATLSPKC
jgi:hypothetical protein